MLFSCVRLRTRYNLVVILMLGFDLNSNVYKLNKDGDICGYKNIQETTHYEEENGHINNLISVSSSLPFKVLLRDLYRDLNFGIEDVLSWMLIDRSIRCTNHADCWCHYN